MDRELTAVTAQTKNCVKRGNYAQSGEISKEMLVEYYNDLK